MDLLRQTIQLCKQYGIKPSRSKGQNFLVDDGVYDQMIAAADLKADETVLEVGPGLGFLTAKLARSAGRVVSVELDDKLAGVLRTGVVAKKIENVEVRNEDILDLRLASAGLEAGKYKVVANLPYNITSVFLRKFLSDASLRPEAMTLMLQKEVAERICAKPGKMSLLAVSVQFYAEPEIMAQVPKTAFWPQPEVDSAIVKLKVESIKYKVDEREFFRLVKFGFSSKRKMLKNNLAAGYCITQERAEEMIIKAGFSGKVRAQELAVANWVRLQEFVKEPKSL